MKKLNGNMTKFSDGFKSYTYAVFKKFFDARYEGSIEPHLKYLGIKKPKRNKGDD